MATRVRNRSGVFALAALAAVAVLLVALLRAYVM